MKKRRKCVLKPRTKCDIDWPKCCEFNCKRATGPGELDGNDTIRLYATVFDEKKRVLLDFESTPNRLSSFEKNHELVRQMIAALL